MRKIPTLVILGLAVVAASSLLRYSGHVAAAAPQSAAVFDSDGRMELPNPASFRRWVFVGAPLTPNGLNNGKAGLPEYHHVYVEAKNVDAYLKTGSRSEERRVGKE